LDRPSKQTGKEGEEKEEEEEEAAAPPKTTATGYHVFLNPHKTKPCPLISKEEISKDTRRYRFG